VALFYSKEVENLREENAKLQEQLEMYDLRKEQMHMQVWTPIVVLKIQWNFEKKPRGLYFSKAFFGGLIFGGAYIGRGLCTEGILRFKIDWAGLIVGRKFTVFALFHFVFEGNFQVQAPGGLTFGGAI